MKRSTARISVAAFLAAATLLTGCNSDDSGGSAGKAPSSGSTSTPSESGTTDATDGGDTGGGELDEANFYEEVMAAQMEAGSFRMKATTTAAGISSVVEGESVYRDGKLFGHVKSGAGSAQQMEGIIADGVLYLKATGIPVPDGKWLKLDPNAPDGANGALAGLASAANPEAMLRAMGDLTKLSKVGAEEVEGVETDHYEATMSTKNFASALGLPAEAAGMLPASLPFDMWIDDDNRPVKMSMDFEIAGQKSSTEQTYFDYGADVDVTVPKDSDTVTPKQAGLAGLGG